MTTAKILLVDDDSSFRKMMSHHLEAKFEVSSAESGIAALECLEKESYDLVISDIKMPGMKGYELLAKIKENYPKTKTALITGWSVDENIQNALKFGVSNIISKKAPFDFKEFDALIHNLLTNDIFGLERYLESDAEIKQFRFNQSSEMAKAREEVLEFFKPLVSREERLLILKLVLDEVINNAFYHPSGEQKGSDICLPRNAFVEIVYGKDSKQFGISVSDNFGKLDSKTILTNLDKCINPTEESILAEDGRGLFIIRSMVSQLIINIQKDVRTETVALLNIKEKEENIEENKSLLVFEV